MSKRPLVLIVDDDAVSRELLAGYLEAVECDVVEAVDGADALATIARRRPDLVLLDVMMPGPVDGLAVCRRLKSEPLTRLVPVVLITALNNVAARVKGYVHGADDYLAKPVSQAELVARTRSLLGMKKIFERMAQTEQVVLAFAAAVEARDPNTQAHQSRVAAMAGAVGLRVGLGEQELADLRFGALIHDIGKIGVPDAILLKPGGLTPEETRRIQDHAAIGALILRPLESLAASLPVVRHHHERMDGGGYPDGLRGESIPIAARIVSVCDAYDAMTSDRPYRSRLDPAVARAELVRHSGSMWDPGLVTAFLAVTGAGASRLPGPLVGSAA